MTAEEYIKAYTRGCSNELVGGGYHEWLTPENALAAVELAREEKQEPASEDLEREMDKYFETMPVLEYENIFEDTFQRIAKHFAQWQKERMMKDAIDTRIDKRLADMIGYTGSERVKVIIIKE